MNFPDYDYYGLLASTWDLWRDDTSNWSDRSFFLNRIRDHGEPVLDLGCGTGRLILDYLSHGIRVEGVDNSEAMLQICRSKAERLGLSPILHRSRIEELELPGRYRTILGASSALQILPDVAVAKRALCRIFEHLLPGGAFAGSFAFEWRPGDPLDTGWTLLFEKIRPEDGATVRSWVREWREPERRLWHTEQRFEVEVDGKIVQTESQRRSPEGRWYSQAEVVELFREVGFAEVRLFHEFSEDPALDGDRLFCVLGVKT